MDFQKNEVKQEQSAVQKKIEKAKKNAHIVKAIEKLEKEIARLQKNIDNKRAKIEELAEQL